MGSKDDAAKASVRRLKDAAKVETISLTVLAGAKESDREVRFDEALDTLLRYRHRRHDRLGCVKVAQFGVGDGHGIIRR